MSPCLTLSIIRYGSRVKWSNPGKGLAPSPTHWCCSYRKGSLRITLDYGRQLYLLYYWYVQPKSTQKWNAQNSLWLQMNNLFQTRRPDLVLINTNEIICHLADHGGKINKSEKINLRASEELKKLWNMRMMMRPTALGTIPKSFRKKDRSNLKSEEESRLYRLQSS